MYFQQSIKIIIIRFEILLIKNLIIYIFCNKSDFYLYKNIEYVTFIFVLIKSSLIKTPT